MSVVIVVGAYVRLEDAGLGCPDWPGCYGQLLGVPEQEHEIARAREHFEQAVDVARARKEMFHRYLAGTLGLLILAIAILAWRGRRILPYSPFLASALVLLVIFQAALGKWTVTMLLKPVIVTLRESSLPQAASSARHRHSARQRRRHDARAPSPRRPG